MIVNGEGQFDQDVLVFGNQFRIEYNQLVKAKNSSQCVMVLVKNVIAITINNQFLWAQPYTILSKGVDDNVKTQLFQLHTKLTCHQPPMRKVIYSCYFFNPFWKLYVFSTIGSLMISFFQVVGGIIYTQSSSPSFANFLCRMSCVGYCCCTYELWCAL